MALTLTRRAGESIVIGDSTIKVIRVNGHKVTLGVESPADVTIRRGELTKCGEATWPEGAATGLGSLFEDSGPPSDQFPVPVANWSNES